MLFHTWIFFVFFIVFYAVFLLLRGSRWLNPWLLFSSYVFYAWWNPLYLALIVFSTTVDYLAVLRMETARSKKPWLAVSVAVNLGLLGFFKYAGFITDNVNLVLANLGAGFAVAAPDVLLPVGISFFTFQSMSYTIDAYRGRLQTERSFVRFATFVSLFPQLVAGPIERAGNLLPQLVTPAPITRRDVSDGLSLFLVGYFKKVAMADYLGLYVDKVYGTPGEFQAGALIFATFAFGWQIYFDFSGYTDMARGIARLMGLRLMVNFNKPYTAVDLGDFWARWHISLSTWFRDYVYIPLGGNRGSRMVLYRNIFLTMVLSGLWHGAAWGFVIWGGLHAIGRVATRRLERTAAYQNRVPRIVKQLLVFGFVTFAWIFFRAPSIQDAWIVLSRIFTTGWGDPRFPVVLLSMVLAIWAYQIVSAHGGLGRRVLEAPPVRIGLALLMIGWLVLVAQPSSQPFIYFQF